MLAAAGVALVCDLLKGNNEHLRELAVELKVRHEEAERRINLIDKKTKRTPDMTSVKPVTAVVVTPAAAPAMPAPREQPEAVPVEVPLPRVAATVEAPRTARPDRRRREMSPAVAAVAQAAATIANREQQNQPAFASASSTANGAYTEEPMNAQDASQSGGRKNWDSILKKTPPRQGALIPFESIREAVPAGFHDASVLQRSVEGGRTLSGLVVSIGTNGLGSEPSSEVRQYLEDMLSEQDFACQSGSDEFVLICTGEQGASAQRRLSAIAEKLWDFQLRSIGDSGVQFSWGSFEARGERIGEAVAAAIEQMQETRSSRRSNIAKAV